MVVRPQTLNSLDTAESSVHTAMSQGQAPLTVSRVDLAQKQTAVAPQQTTVALPQTTFAPLLQTTIDEDCETSADEEASETRESVNGRESQLDHRRAGFQSLGACSLSSLDTSFDEEGSDSVNPRHSVRRDRSHTWSHGPMKFRTAKRSGSLPPMDSIMTQVPKLNLSEGRDSPFPCNTPTCVSPHKYGKLLVCSEHRMSTSPRLPPIGCVSDQQSPRSVPKNYPRELTREVTVIDPALVDNVDTTEVRMMGRRRNALMTPQPSTPGRES